MATGTGNLPYSMSPVSPFDVITSQAENEKIANIESLADGTGIGDEAITLPKINGGTTAGVLVTDASGNVSSESKDYTTTEVDTGAKWIDGKTIYRKTINFGALPNSTTKTVAHSITGMTSCLNVQIFAKNGSNTHFFGNTPDPGANANAIQFYVNLTNILCVTAVNQSGFSTCYVTLSYVK